LYGNLEDIKSMKKEQSRYDTSEMIDAQIEPGSGGRVLKNLLGIKRKREMDQVEGLEQRRALDELIRIYDKDHRFTSADVRKIHQLWLGKVYKWAGSYRQVNVSKDGFMFAAASIFLT
jgi:cell filamentation protein